MLKEVDRYNDNMAYLYSLVGFRSARNEYIQISPQKMIAEVKAAVPIWPQRSPPTSRATSGTIPP